jgi:hypothetical protein
MVILPDNAADHMAATIDGDSILRPIAAHVHLLVSGLFCNFGNIPKEHLPVCPTMVICTRRNNDDWQSTSERMRRIWDYDDERNSHLQNHEVSWL